MEKNRKEKKEKKRGRGDETKERRNKKEFDNIRINTDYHNEIVKHMKSTY